MTELIRGRRRQKGQGLPGTRPTCLAAWELKVNLWECIGISLGLLVPLKG